MNDLESEFTFIIWLLPIIVLLLIVIKLLSLQCLDLT